MTGVNEDIDLVKELAEKGDAVAQTSIGFMYANGQGVERDEKEAVKWYRKAAGNWRLLQYTATGHWSTPPPPQSQPKDDDTGGSDWTQLLPMPLFPPPPSPDENNP